MMDSNTRELDLSSHNNNLLSEEVSVANLDHVASGNAIPEDESVKEEDVRKMDTAALAAHVEQLVARANKPPVAPEDEYIAPGRKRYDRESLTAFNEELVNPRSKIIHNSEICR